MKYLCVSQEPSHTQITHARKKFDVYDKVSSKYLSVMSLVSGQSQPALLRLNVADCCLLLQNGSGSILREDLKRVFTDLFPSLNKWVRHTHTHVGMGPIWAFFHWLAILNVDPRLIFHFFIYIRVQFVAELRRVRNVTLQICGSNVLIRKWKQSSCNM